MYVHNNNNYYYYYGIVLGHCINQTKNAQSYHNSENLIHGIIMKNL